MVSNVIGSMTSSQAGQATPPEPSQLMLANENRRYGAGCFARAVAYCGTHI
jgi:hypothetical protein